MSEHLRVHPASDAHENNSDVLGMFGPVSSGRSEGIGPFWLTCFSLLGLWFVWKTIRLLIRERRIRQNAKHRGYAYIGDQLPKDFPLSNSSFQDASIIHTAFTGESRRGRQFVSFDCTLGSGKGKRRRSVIAVRAPRESFGARLDVSLTLETVDSWTLVYRNRGLLSPSEIEAIVSGL